MKIIAALAQKDPDMTPMAQIVRGLVHPAVPDWLVSSITDTVLATLAKEAWNRQELADWHDAQRIDGTDPGPSAVIARPEWSHVAAWLSGARK